MQVTTTCGKDFNSWSKFRLINISGLPSAQEFVQRPSKEQKAISVYYLSVTKWTSTDILGAFPGCIPVRAEPVRGRECGVFLTWSSDGFKWSQPKLLEPQSAADHVHVSLNPAGFLNRRLVLMKRTCNGTDRFSISRELPQNLEEAWSGPDETVPFALSGSLSPLWKPK